MCRQYKASLLIKKVGLSMKVNKTQALMYLLSVLLTNKQISKEFIKNKLEISDLTFRRYMQEIRAYLINFELPYELKYLKGEDIYSLVDL